MFKDEKVLAVIPARGGSRGLPRKNILLAKGKPLIWYSYEAAEGSSYIDSTILSTDDNEITEVAEKHGINVPFRRPSELASDTAGSVDVVLHAAAYFPDYKYVVLLQPTCPLRITEDIDRCFELMELRSAPACVTIVEPKHKPEWMFTLDTDAKIHTYLNGMQPPSQRQKMASVYSLNGVVYVAKIEWLLEHRSFVAEGCIGSIMPATRSLDIDTEDDFRIFQREING